MPFRPRYTGLIDKYRDRLPVHDDTRVISLGEGNTPLIRLNNIPREIGKDVDIYVKYEGLNPTGSFKDRGMTRAFVERCKEAAYTALCLTVDTPVAGNRERDNYYGMMATAKPALRSVPSMLRHPGWLYRAVVRKDMELVNITQVEDTQQFTDMSIKDFIDSQFDRSLTWKDVEWLAGEWGGPLIIKGVQTVDDSRKAADSGATAVMLSNHGGRQLEGSPAPVDSVAAVADALRDRLEIICDGGIRRGTHIVKALALGANACSIGRAYLYPLAAGGQRGVERGLGLLRDEMLRAMALLGCDKLAGLDGRYIQKRG